MKKNIFLTSLFIVIIFISILDSLFNFSPIKDIFEKRVLVTKPNLFPIKDYTKNFENFFNDNYGMRKTFISIHSQIMDKFFNESPNDRAIRGKQGWLYFDNFNSLLDIASRTSIDDDLIEEGIKYFYQNWQEMKKRNIAYLLVIAPDKSSIYFEFLPDSFSKINHNNLRSDKFFYALKNRYPDFPVINLKETMLKAKEKEEKDVYHKTDTHWNRSGAHYAYLEIAKKLNITPKQRKDFISKNDEMIVGDISQIMNIRDSNINYELQPKFKKSFKEIDPTKEEMKEFRKFYISKNYNPNLPTIFVYKDSFFDNLLFFMNEHASMLYATNQFPCKIDYNKIKKYKPNILIQEFFEPRTESVLKNCLIDKLD